MNKLNEEQLLSAHYQAFYEMVFTIALVANVSTPEFDADARKIVGLIGSAYGLEEDVINLFGDLIVDELTALPTWKSACAYTENIPANFPHKDAYAIKADVIYALHNLADPYLNEPHFPIPERFNCATYVPYFPSLRRNELQHAAAMGNLACNRALALFEELGLGGEKDHEGALIRLKQCAYWGDGLSFRLLALLGEGKTKEIFAKMVDLIPQLNAGQLHLGKDEDPELAEAYEVIAATRQSIVFSLLIDKIDYSYVEAIMAPDIPLSQKLLYAKYYQARGWKEATNSPKNNAARFGFRHKED